jgi:hypothetical protein
MKRYLLIFFIIINFTQCSYRSGKNEFEYVKIFQMGYSDSVTEYNKGLSAAWYFEYDFGNDSVIHRIPVGDADNYIFKTFAGKFSNERYVDTITNLLKFLRKYPDGQIPNSLDTLDANYCGPKFFVELKDKQGEHYYSFILEGDSQIRNFENFYFRLNELPWGRKQVSNNIISVEDIAVRSAIKLGYYNKIDPPYYPLQCDSVIDMEKIYGEWRSSSHAKRSFETKNKYKKTTFTTNGIYKYEHMKNDTSTNLFTAKFSLDIKNKLVVLNNNISLKKLKVIRLTDNCFEYYDPHAKYNIVLNRLDTSTPK